MPKTIDDILDDDTNHTQDTMTDLETSQVMDRHFTTSSSSDEEIHMESIGYPAFGLNRSFL